MAQPFDFFRTWTVVKHLADDVSRHNIATMHQNYGEPMYIFELTRPGGWLDHEDQKWRKNAEDLITHLELQFFEANTALNLFAHSDYRPVQSKEQRKADYRMRLEIEDRIESEVGQRGANYRDVRFEAEIQFKRQKWMQGKLPQQFELMTRFIYARAFLYALDGFDKFLKVLSEEPCAPAGVAELYKHMAKAFPDLRMVRNSAQHLEDRARGLDEKKKPLVLKPIPRQGSDGGSAGLVINMLDGTKYGNTMANGHYGSVDVSPDSMEKLRQIMQAVYSCFRWVGSKEHLPR